MLEDRVPVAACLLGRSLRRSYRTNNRFGIVWIVTQVGQNSYQDVWFYFAENFDDLADGNYQHEWVPFRLVDCQKLNDATAAPLASPLSVTISDGDVVNLSRWASEGIANRHSNGATARDYAVQQGAGLSAKELVYVRAQRAGAAGPSSSPPLDRHKSADVATCCLPCNFCSWRTTIPASLLRWTFARRFTPLSRATTSSTPLNLGLTLSWKRAGHPAQRQNS